MGVMAANWQQFGTTLGPVSGALRQFGSLMGQLLPGFVSQFLRMLNNADNMFISLASGVSTIAVPGLKILGQTFQGVQNFIEPVLNAIEGKFVPALDNLVQVIAPVIAGFLQWVANSGAIPAIFRGLGQAVSVVVTVISFLINILAGLITFFSQNAVGIAIFRAALILIGTVLGVIAAVAIPLLIGALISMGIAAVTTGIEMAIAFAPIVIPILAIIAVITLVVLAVTHWGQIAGWIQGVWSTTLNAIGNFFSSAWQAIQSKTTQFMSFLGSAVQSGMKAVYDFFIAPINLMGQAFVWLYQHNIYIKLMVDTIMQDITRLASWLNSTFNTIKNAVISAFLYVYNGANMYWSLITSTIRQWSTATWSFLVGIWNQIVSFLTAQGQRAWSAVVSMWQQISGVFSSAWGTYVAGPLNSIGASIGNFFSGLINEALQFGERFMSMLAQGITNGIGAVGAAASNAAGQIAKFLGFHSPTELGPGSTAHQWMPNLVNMMATGLLNGAPVIAGAANTVAGSLTPLNGITTGVSSLHAATHHTSGAQKSGSVSAQTLTFTAPSTHMHAATSTHHHLATTTHHHLAPGVHHHLATGTHHHLASGTHHHLGANTHNHHDVGKHAHLASGVHHHLASGVHHHLAAGVHHHLAKGTHHHLAATTSYYMAPSANTYSGTNNNTFTGTNNNKFATNANNNNGNGKKQVTLIFEIDGRQFGRAIVDDLGDELVKRIRLSGRAA